MAKTEWGLKRTCLSCGARFYDLTKKKDIVCPKCEAAFDPDAAVKLKRSRGMPAEVKKTAAPKVDLLVAEVENSDDALNNTDDESVLEDTSDLDNDEVVVAVPTDEGNEDT